MNIKLKDDTKKLELIQYKVWLNSSEAAFYTGVSEGNLRTMVCRGLLVPHNFNGRSRYHKSELDNYIRSKSKR